MSRVFELKVKGYTKLIKGGRITIDSVPKEFRDAVSRKLEKE